jgi:exocyst complex component 4
MPQKMLSNIDTNKPMFTFDDYNAMLALQCNKDTDAESADLNAHLIDLHAVAMNVEGWEVGL